MKKKIVALLLVIALCIGLYQFIPFKKELVLPQLIDKDATAICVDVDDGTVYFEVNPDEVRHTASTVKVLTALVAYDYYKDMNAKLTVKDLETLPDQQFIRDIPVSNGEQFLVKDAFHALMMRSSNEMALTFATNYKTGYDGFVKDMNNKAKELGCEHAEFVNPHGLTYVQRGWEKEKCSARDMSILMKAYYENNDLLDIIKEKSYTMSSTNSKPERQLTCIPISRPSSPYYDERVIGGKTGFTELALRTLVTVSKVRDRTVITVIFHQTSMKKNYKNHRQILDYVNDILYNENRFSLFD